MGSMGVTSEIFSGYWSLYFDPFDHSSLYFSE